jgi:hypothetical protein
MLPSRYLYLLQGVTVIQLKREMRRDLGIPAGRSCWGKGGGGWQLWIQLIKNFASGVKWFYSNFFVLYVTVYCTAAPDTKLVWILQTF